MTTSSRLRWAVPVAVAAVVAGGAALGSGTGSAAPSDLAPRTAQELLTDLASAAPQPLTGTVTETSDLGLPALPASATGTLGPLTLATGTNTLRVATDGADASRVALVGQLAEYDVVRTGTDLWTWSSETSTATRTTLPARTGEQTPPDGVPTTPAEAAAQVLSRIDPTTEVGVDDAVVVAGRAARQLVLVPRDAGTLVGSVRIAVDAQTSIPLRVQVTARGAAAPALDVGFTDLTLGAPDPALLTFTPPPGATVTERTVPTAGAGRRGAAAPAAPTTIGSGWTAVTVLTGGDPKAADGAPGPSPLLDQLTTRVPQGRLLSTALVSVLLTDDGRVLVGAVPPAALQAAA
ncbi:sigma-E factor regulatory protein RseB domain-containing protein [Rhodococcus aerolatus]